MLKNLGKKQKIELTITTIGILILIVLIPMNFQKAKKKSQNLAVGRQDSTGPLAVLPVSGIERYIPQGDWDQDPFYPDVPFSSPRGSLGSFTLNGIVWDKNAPYAIINSEVVKTGDNLNGVKIIEITENTVILEQNGERQSLELATF